MQAICVNDMAMDLTVGMGWVMVVAGKPPDGGGVVGLGSGIDAPSMRAVAWPQVLILPSVAGQTAWMLIAPLDRAWWAAG